MQILNRVFVSFSGLDFPSDPQKVTLQCMSEVVVTWCHYQADHWPKSGEWCHKIIIYHTETLRCNFLSKFDSSTSQIIFLILVSSVTFQLYKKAWPTSLIYGPKRKGFALTLSDLGPRSIGQSLIPLYPCLDFTGVEPTITRVCK